MLVRLRPGPGGLPKALAGRTARIEAIFDADRRPFFEVCLEPYESDEPPHYYVTPSEIEPM